MSFWSTNNVEPKRNFRWLVQFTGLSDLEDSDVGADDVLWWAKTVTTPGYDVSEVAHNFLDNKFHYPGRVTWTEVTLTLVDPVSPDAVGQTNALLEAMGYKIPVNEDTLGTITKASGTAAAQGGTALGDVIIRVLDAEGGDLETWTLKNPFIKSVKYGDLDYSNDELRTITMGIRYDWATCDIKGISATQFDSQ